jgi:GNAT superfamily N-acetyltransferase
VNKTDFVASLRIEPIDAHHDRSSFTCADASLDEYLQRYARQNHQKNIARAYVAVDEDHSVFGYYTLSASRVGFENLPEAIARKLPRYPVPAALIGKLATHVSVQGGGLGARLLIDALTRILGASDEVGIKVILVDALSDTAKAFYQHFGFIELPDQKMTLFIPIETVRKLGLD